MTVQLTVRETRSSPLPDFLDRHFFLIAGLLLATMGGVQIGSAVHDSPTNDEPVHLAAGYVYLTTGDYSMEPTHPPLGRVLAALPLLALPLQHIPAQNAWPGCKTLLWGNQIPADTIIHRARFVIIALTFLFGAWLGWWTRRRFGSAVALLALTFFVFDPTLIAHGHYVTTDLIASLSIFLVCTLWADLLEAPGWKKLTAASLALGLALVSKFSALFLLFVLPLLYGIAWYRNRSQPFFNWFGAIRTTLVMLTGPSLLIVLSYAPEVKALIFSPGAGKGPHSVVRPAPTNACGEIPVPGRVDTGLLSFGYFGGVHELLQFDSEGYPAYLLGHFSRQGWWEYFPIAFLVKTPTGVLIACLVAALSLWRGRRHPPPVLVSLCLALPPVFYFALAMHSSINLGVRHILPIYPFLYVLLAYVLINNAPFLLQRAWRWTVIALIVLVSAESVSVYPHYLAFFNFASGGPLNGSRYLLDSNIDWGQELKSFASFVQHHRITPLCTALFGPAPASYYGIVARDLNQTGMPEGVENLPCFVAVSVNALRGLYNVPTKFAPLPQRRPVARVGYSIYIYDLRHGVSQKPSQ